MNKLQVQKILVIILAILNCVRSESCDESSSYSQRESENRCGVNRNPVSLKDCTRTINIFDAQGNFLKIVCSVHKGYSYNDAENFCFDHGMDLLIVENQAVYDEVAKFTLQQWPTPDVWGDGSGIWINGRVFNNEWFAYKNFKKQPIGRGINTAEENHHPGRCAALKRNHNSFELKNYDCTKGYVFYCEYLL